MEKPKDPIEINKYRSSISEEVKRVNDQQCNANDYQKSRWKNIKGTIDAASKDLRTKDTSIKKKIWFNDACRRAVSKRNEKRLKMLQNTTPETTEEYKSRKAIASKIIRRGKKLAEKERLGNLEK